MYGHGLLTFPFSTVANLLSDHVESYFSVCEGFLFFFTSVCWYVRSGDLRMGVVSVFLDVKKMTVGRRKRKCVSRCKKEDGAVGRRNRRDGGGAEGGHFIGRRSCPALFDM